MLRIINEDDLFVYFTDEFEGLQISFRKNKHTNEIYTLVDDNLSKALGCENLVHLVETIKPGISKQTAQKIASGQMWAKVDESARQGTPMAYKMGEA